MLKKPFKIRRRTGGFRRKIAKEHARIMMSLNPIDAQQNDSCEVSCNDHKEGGSVGHKNQVNIEDNHESEPSCFENSCIANNESIHQSRVVSCPLIAENIRPESSEESDDDSEIKKYVKYSSFREKIRRLAIERNIN